MACACFTLLSVALAKVDEGLRLGEGNEGMEALATIAAGSVELGLTCLEALTVTSMVELVIDTGSGCLDPLTEMALMSPVPDSDG